MSHELALNSYGDAVERSEGPASARRKRRERPTHQGTRARPAHTSTTA